MRQVPINIYDAGQRLDKFLLKYLQGMPEAILYTSLRKEWVRVNGKHVKDGSFKLTEGDELKLFLKDEFFGKKASDTRFYDIIPELDIVYEDENILLVDKKQGMNVHADDDGDSNTLIEHIKSYLHRKGEYKPDEEQSFVPSLCNRIDRNTSGIVIAAKNAETLRIMNEKIKIRELEKRYLCLVHGVPKKHHARLEGYLFKDEKQKRVYVSPEPKKGSKTIVTDYRVIASNDEIALVEVLLITGRTHQIRAHLSWLGHPLVGDGKYGNNRKNLALGYDKQALCAYRLKFTFKTDAGILSYLDGREFFARSAEFLKEFEGIRLEEI